MPRYYVSSRLSERISETPEGYLLCLEVPITRTGELIYGPNETPIETGDDGQVVITRDEKDVFDEKTMASFEGKPVTLDHPADFVSPENWKDLTVGVVQNVRRGEGEDKDKLLSNLLITDAQAIQKVKSGLREVSCGYDAEYEQISPGKGRQKDIMGNHVALVERGRAGPECAVRDSAYTERNTIMKLKDKFLSVFGRAWDEAMEAEKKEGEVVGDEDPKEEKKEEKAKDEPDMEGRLASLEEGHAKILALLEEIAKEEKAEQGDEETEPSEDEDPEEEKAEDEESEGKGMDSETIARAEILAPGLASGKDMKVRALEAAYGTKDGRSVIHKFTDGKKPDLKNKSTVDMLFVAASERLKDVRAEKMIAARTADMASVFSGPMTPEKLNEINAARFGRK